MSQISFIYVILITVVVSQTAAGLKCWQCKNARSNAECLRQGQLKQCLPNQKYCQNEVRAIASGRFYEITKRCKQTDACTNNQLQNSTYSSLQCVVGNPSSVCRCCCGFDNCNGPSVVCPMRKRTCPYPARPVNGMVYCPTHSMTGTYCYYRCLPGYKLYGSYKTQCLNSATGTRWSNDLPTCEATPCRPLNDPEEGAITCTDNWNIGSACTFSCSSERVLVGHRTLKCSIFSTWTDNEPVCSIVTCLPPQPLDRNFVERFGDCSDRYNFGSICSFQCDPDYDLVGNDKISCGRPLKDNGVGTWDKAMPSCRRKRCEPAYCPTNVVGDTCTTSCPRCQTLEGSSSVTCTRSGWSGSLGICIKITCDNPPPNPEDGSMASCNSNDYECGSSCRYACNAGFKMVGSAVVTCLESGLWGGNVPVCETSECDEITNPGITATCTDGVATGSRCTLSCSQRNHELVGEAEVTCTKESSSATPVWTPQLSHYCRPILCTVFPREGEVPGKDVGNITCVLPLERVPEDIDRREGLLVGTQCTLQCFEDEYRPKHLIDTTECDASGVWTAPTLCCVQCVVNTNLDVVVFLDSTEPVYWLDRLTYIGWFFDFLVFDYSYVLNFTIIPFGNDLDLDNQFPFLLWDDDRNMRDPVRVFNDLINKKRNSEEASNSGKALQYALDDIFGYHDYRVPMVFLFTAREPSDLALARSAAASLSEQKIHLRIFPVTGRLTASAPSSRVRDTFLELVGGDENYVVERAKTDGDETNFYLLGAEDLITVTKKLCRHRVEETAPCQFA